MLKWHIVLVLAKCNADVDVILSNNRHYAKDIDDDDDNNHDGKPKNCYIQQAMLSQDSQLIKIIPRNPRHRRRDIISIR